MGCRLEARASSQLFSLQTIVLSIVLLLLLTLFVMAHRLFVRVLPGLPA